MAILTFEATNTTITALISGMDTGFIFTREYHWNISTKYPIESTDYSHTTTTPPHAGSTSTIFTNLSPNTLYYIKVDIMNRDEGNWLTALEGQYKTSGVSVSPWSWFASNGSATAAQTIAAYNALTNKGKTTEFSHKVWNDFVNKIYEVLQYKNELWWGNYLYFEDTKFTGSGEIMTADMFNSAKYNIGARYSTGIPDVKTNDPMYGSLFISLADKLNEWIETL